MCPDFSKMRLKNKEKWPEAGKAVPKIPWLFGQKSIFGTADFVSFLWYTLSKNCAQFDALRGQKQGFAQEKGEISPLLCFSTHAVAEGAIRQRILKEVRSFLV
jgi:hypothetical protein